MISRLIPDLADWDVSILATDINPEGFATARAAEYTQWSFRGTPSWVMNGYFTKVREGRYRLSPAIQEMVTFRYLNLIAGYLPRRLRPHPVPQRDHVLLTRHRRAGGGQTAVRRSGQNGYLLVTASETGRDIQGSLTSLTLGGEIVYKQTPPSRAAPRPRPDRPPRTPAARRPRPRAESDQPCRAEPERLKRTEAKRPSLALWNAEPTLATSIPPTTARDATDAHTAAEEARLLADRGDLDQALDRCDAVLACEKLNPSLYYLKASILQELGRPEEAEQALQSTLFLGRRLRAGPGHAGRHSPQPVENQRSGQALPRGPGVARADAL